ncbi:protein lunapark-like protein [Leptotrombidium deliense]|uniref:Endoplasmic reticulum junction formation protein lunapark n=1 Tax=Leptotrombidium deliense TaxID=299467 RepID=A0A443SP35_9ACAR|nr:protein lunapark-like protein [Leptotrombidium deliense]
MGIIISRFKKKLSTKEQLEKLQHEIEFLEDYKWSTLRSQKHVVGLLFVISGVVFTIVALLFYFYKFNQSTNLQEKVVYSVLLALFPLLVYGAKRGLQWYYVWDIDAQEEKLRAMKREKKKILEKVMETETYKVAKELLEKYDPSALKDKSETRHQVQRVQDSSYSLRNRGSNISARYSPNSTFSSPTPGVRSFQRTPMPGIPPMNISQQMRTPMLAAPRLPRPVFPQNRGVVEKLVDYVVGDGPSNRYALICFNCKSHNGMALKDEFEYLAFRCCYCFTFNPSRKERPFAPRLLPIDAGRPSLTPVVDEPESDSESKKNDTLNIEEVSHVSEIEPIDEDDSEESDTGDRVLM